MDVFSMDDLIHINNKLQDILLYIFSALGCPSIDSIDLPQIVVIGMQSGGKTSVIEGLVRKDFLPRGIGIVTRCPLVLQLVHVSKDDKMVKRPGDNVEEWAKFLDYPDRFYSDFSLVRDEIDRLTNERCGEDKGICDVPINLKIFSHKVSNLTLVDLPGITKIPVGSQPEDIEAQIERMAMKYIENPNSIILAITPANNDFSTSDAIKLARKVDREGKRTLAVLTKLDTVEDRSDMLEVLRGLKITIKLGIIGVVNRSQEDIQSKKTIEDAIKAEQAFLEANYMAVANQNGIPHLSKTLNLLLVNHIRNCLPDLKTRIRSAEKKHRSDLDKYGEVVEDHRKWLSYFIEKFALSFKDTIDGNTHEPFTTELVGGAKIREIFETNFREEIYDISPLEDVDDLSIISALKNSAGTRQTLFIPDAAFECVVKKEIRKLTDPSLNCVDRVHEEMRVITSNCATEVMARFPLLQERVVDVVNTLLECRIDRTRKVICGLLDAEIEHINTKHPEFCAFKNIEAHFKDPDELEEDDNSYVDKVGAFNKVSQLPSKVRPELSGMQSPTHGLTPRENRDCKLIRKLIECYFKIIQRDVMDKVPKIVMYFLVNAVKKCLQSELRDHFYEYTKLADLFGESQNVSKQRKKIMKRLETLQDASNVINSLRGTWIM